MKKFLMSVVLAGVTAFSAFTAVAADGAKVVLQLSDNDPGKQTLVLNVANNLQSSYGVGNATIEIVAFGPGLDLLLKDNSNGDRIQQLAMNGVRFSACGNTMKGIAKKTGKEPELNPNAVKVAVGVGRIVELSGQGYTIVRP